MSENPTEEETDLSSEAEAADTAGAVLQNSFQTPGAPSWLDQDPVLRDLWQQQLQPAEIAEKLGRSVAAVMTRAARLGLPRRFAPGRKAGQRYGRPQPATDQTTRKATRRSVEDGGAEDRQVERSERVCLMCLRKFQSEGRHNRICPSCKGSPEYAAGNRIPDISFGEG